LSDGPSTFVPFLRRFGNERQKELDEVRALYGRVKASQDRFGETRATFGQRVYQHFNVPDCLRDPFAEALMWLVVGERQIWQLPPPDFDRMNLKEFVEYRNLLMAKEYFFANQAELLDLIEEGIVYTLRGVLRDLPAMEEPTPFTIPLIYTLPNPRLEVEKVYGNLTRVGYHDRGLFLDVIRQLHRNLCVASGRDPEDTKSAKPFKMASASTLPLDELVETYLKDTPYRDLFMAPVPLQLTHEVRFNHMHIVGGTGAGKTTLLEHLTYHDITAEDPPSLVVIDPHRDLIGKLATADLGTEDRLIIIDPRDIEHPPALNIFALNQERLAGYDEATREQVTAGVIQTFDYLFSGLLGADLTAKQGVFFRYIARLMLSLPDAMGRNATILDMLRLMTDAAPYEDAIRRLPDIPREFFRHDFASKTFVQTKEQIRYRLQAILENPTMARLFTSTETKVDLFEEMNRGAIILVDTAKDYLKGASANFGRIFISLTLQAVLERAAVDAAKRKATFLIVDEAASYFDSNIDDLLTEARKYRCGLVLAHQYLDQATGSLRASLAANTGIKFAAGLSASDARAMAPEMRTTPDFILDQPRLHFAAHVRNVTPHAVSVPISPGLYAGLPKRPERVQEAVLELNRFRVSVPKPRPFSAPPESGPADVAPMQPPPDISPEW
jgi:hypothetical protein